MDGYTATRHIRALKNQALARLPIIAISANAFDEDMEASYEAGMNGHLAKPIIVSELFETLGRILFTAEYFFWYSFSLFPENIISPREPQILSGNYYSD